MIRVYDAVLVGAVIAAASATFWVKYDTRAIASETRSLEKRIAEEESAISLGEAEWSVLTQPDRVQTLVKVHEETLGLRPIEPDQLVTVETLNAELDAVAAASVEAALEGILGTDEVMTGAIE